MFVNNLYGTPKPEAGGWDGLCKKGSPEACEALEKRAMEAAEKNM